MSEIPVDVKRQVLLNEIREWEVGLYQLGIRHRVHKKLEADQAELDKLVESMVRCEKAIDLLNSELAAL